LKASLEVKIDVERKKDEEMNSSNKSSNYLDIKIYINQSLTLISLLTVSLVLFVV